MGLLFTGAIQRSIMKRRKTSAIPDVSSIHDVADERQLLLTQTFQRNRYYIAHRSRINEPEYTGSNTALRHDWLHRLKTVFSRFSLAMTPGMNDREQRLVALSKCAQS
jgi:hypothetical protein